MPVLTPEMVSAAERKIDALRAGLAVQAAEEPLRSVRLRITEAGRVTEIPMLPASSGDWRIETFEVTPRDEEFERMRAVVSLSSRGRFRRAGRYTALKRGGATVMSDTPDELLDLLDFFREARGRVLVNGLGLGCAVKLALAKPEVEHVDVVEFSEDVIALVAPYFRSDRVTIHQGDAYSFRFPPRTRWDVVWHDVWDSISADNDFATLHRRYGGRCDWQGSWCRAEAERAERRWRAENSWWLNR